MKVQRIHPASALTGALVVLGAYLLGGMQLPKGVSNEKQAILRHMSIVYLPDGRGGMAKTIRFSGVNVQVVNGLKATNGSPANPDSTDPLTTSVNGVGNLIVGYNELGNPFGDERTGSHNMVVGHGNSYTSFGGFVGPLDNGTFAPFAAVTGGAWNQARGVGSSISGGHSNRALEHCSSVSGGTLNIAVARRTSVSGGMNNEATGYYASVSGGLENTAGGNYSSVSGGYFNQASGKNSTVTGGASHIASGYYSSISGGFNRSVSGKDDWRAGSLFEDN